MAAWMINHIWWLVAALVVLLVGLKVAIALVFRRLAAASEEGAG